MKLIRKPDKMKWKSNLNLQFICSIAKNIRQDLCLNVADDVVFAARRK